MNNERSGNSVSVLLSGNYNNFVCNRALPENASDYDFSTEFDKATALAEEALTKHKQLSDEKYNFDQLCQEYIFLRRYFAPAEENQSSPREEDMTDGEKQAWERLQKFDRLMENNKDPWQWQHTINGTEDPESPF